MYQEAWVFLVQYGPGALSDEALCQVVLSQLQAQDMQEDEWLLGFAMHCFLAGFRQRPLLEYLCNYYQGPVKHLASLWRAAAKQQLKANELEERLLIQMVFTAAFTSDTSAIFRSYCSHPVRETVSLAYLTYFSYAAFFQGADVEPELYLYLEQETLKRRGVNEYLRLALIRHYTKLAVLTPEQEQFIDSMLDEYLGKDTCFPCFLELPDRILVRHQLYDLQVIEYHSRVEHAQVWLSYRIVSGERDFTRVELESMAGSTYLWQMRMTAGERLEYFITEKSGRMETVTKSCYLDAPAFSDVPDNRYGRLSRMQRADLAGDREALVKEMEEYQALENLTGRLFRVR
jgi:hypothetical protein